MLRYPSPEEQICQPMHYIVIGIVSYYRRHHTTKNNMITNRFMCLSCIVSVSAILYSSSNSHSNALHLSSNPTVYMLDLIVYAESKDNIVGIEGLTNPTPGVIVSY